MTATAEPAAGSATGEGLGRRLYTTMVVAEALDERLRKGIARGEFAVAIWPARGQEAIAAGLGAALRTDDRLVTTYRGLHDLVAKGVPLTEILGEVLGRTTGASRGKGGTMHITAPDQGVMLSTGIVGAGLPVAVGLALAARQQGSDRVVAVCFGDGATNTGSFHEALNLAATWKLPVVAVCQNNQFAELTPREDTMPIERIADRALAYAMPSATVDGNDPQAVHDAVAEAVGRGRTGGGPTLLECVTFRLQGHYFGDPQKYMPADRLAAANEADPVPRYRDRLVGDGVLTADEADTIKDDAIASVEAALTEVRAADPPGPEELDTDVYFSMEGIPR